MIETFTVSAARLAYGKWNHATNKEEGEGDIAAAYSADVIATNGRIRKPFKFRYQGQEFPCCTVGMSSNNADAYRLLTPEQFALPTTTYAEKTHHDGGETARNDPMGFYHGMAVKHGGKNFVLCGPELRFRAEGAEEPAPEPTECLIKGKYDAPPPCAPEATPPDPAPCPEATLPPMDHTQGRTKTEIRAYLAKFADRQDSETAYADLWGRATTFGDLRRLTAGRQESAQFSFMEEIPA